MHTTFEVKQLIDMTPLQLQQLSELLIDVVNDGASIGFLAPLDYHEAEAYWKQVISPHVKLWVAVEKQHIIGTIQLHLAEKRNARHRAEVCKLFVHPLSRGRGIAQTLMCTMEQAAKQEGRSLLVLDTREGDVSNDLYRKLGYMEAGRIPRYAASSNEQLDATLYFYKEL